MKKNPFEVRIERMARQAKPSESAKEATAPPPADLANLPACADHQRLCNNALLRCALYSGRNKNTPRVYLKDAVIQSRGGVTVEYTGEELRQDDLTVFLQLVRLAKSSGVGAVVFNSYMICGAVGLATNPASYRRLKECLHRLQSGQVNIYTKENKGVVFSHIESFEWDGKVGDVQIVHLYMPRQLIELFKKNEYTHLNFKERLDLPDGLARWLHGYYSTHEYPFEVKTDTLLECAGISCERRRDGRTLIKTALGKLEAVGFLKSSIIEGYLVKVERNL